MILKNSRFLLITLVLIIALLLVVIVFGVYDMRLKNIENSRLLNEANQVAEAKDITKTIKVIQNSAVEDIKAFNDLVLTSDKLVPLIESIESKGRELGLVTKIVSVEKNEDRESSELNTISLVIESRGSWTGTFAFLGAIESLPHKVMIEESSLSQAEEEWRLRIVLLLNSFN